MIKAHLHKLLRWEVLLYVFIFIAFWINSSYVSYPDEFVNLLGGKAILTGHVPYKDFFDHHLPLAWFLSAFLLLFSFGSFVLFRFWWAVWMFVSLLLVGLWVKKHHRDWFTPYLVFFFLYPLVAVYFWLHLFIADSLAVLFFSMTFWIVFLETYAGRARFKPLVYASVLTSCIIFSSLTYLYLALALYAWELYLMWRADGLKNSVKMIGIMAIPYLILALIITVTGAWKDFFFANFTYNTQLYISIPNYEKGRFFNPIKFALTLMFNFFTNYLPLLSKIKYLDLYLPIGVMAGLGTLTFLIILASRNVVFGILFFFLLSFSAPRSDIQMTKETDYQMGVFLMLGVMTTIISIWYLMRHEYKLRLVEDAKRVVQLLLFIFLLFTGIFLLANTFNKFYLRYTQKMPSIDSRSDSAAFMDEILTANDAAWIGPYEPNNLFFMQKAKLDSKYPTLLPQFKESELLRNDFLGQLEKDPPKLIIYSHVASIFMTPADKFGDFFLDWMKPRYTRLNAAGVTVLKSPTPFNIKDDLYLRNDAKDELLRKLQEQGYIQY